MNWIVVFLISFFCHVNANPSNPSHGSCTYPTPVSTIQSPPPITSHLLLSPFFQHFQQSYLHLPAKGRESNWRTFVRLLTPSLEKIISSNVSTHGEGPLLLNQDITLHKMNSKTLRRETVEGISGSANVPPSLLSALDDGLSLTVHRLERRMASVNTLTASLAQAFGVRVTAEYTIHPEDSGPDIWAQDRIHIVLSKDCTAKLHEGTFRYPLREHEEDVEVIKASQNSDPPIAMRLAEYDLLYVPRGDLVSWSGVEIITISLHTEEMTNADVLKALVDVGSVEEDSPLTDSLPGSEGEYSYGDLLKELLKVGAEVTEDLRKHFVVGESVHEEEDDDSVDIVSDVTERFLGAAHALYEPGLEVLTEYDGFGKWVRGMEDKDEVRKGFAKCVEWLKSKNLIEETVAEVHLRWFERREVEEDIELRKRWKCLEKYGESKEWVSFD